MKRTDSERVAKMLRAKAGICREQSQKRLQDKGHGRRNEAFSLQWLFAAMVL